MLKENGTCDGIGGTVPNLDNPDKLFKSYVALSKAINSGLVKTAHDCSQKEVLELLLLRCVSVAEPEPT